MKFFGNKQPAGKRKFVGLSQKPTIANVVKKVTPAEQKKTAPAESRNLFQSLQPYLAVVKDDIKQVLCIDEKSRRKKQDYEDFMEQHFGRKK